MASDLRRDEESVRITDSLFPEHGRTSCSDEDPCNYDPTGSHGCERCTSIMLGQVDALRSEVSRLRAVVDSAVRVMGDHNAPNDCYATGPLTGNPYSDLVECPACAFIKLNEQLKDPTP